MKEATPKAIHLKDYRPPAFLIKHVEIYFDLREQGTRVRSRLAIQRNGVHREALMLDGEALITHRVSLDGIDLEPDVYQVTTSQLKISNVADKFVLETEVEIAPESNTTLEGLYRSNTMFCTQCEAEGFRRITWYLDRPDVMALFTTTIEADRGNFPILLSNGNLVESAMLANNRHRVTWEDPFPKPSYLFALVAGDLALLEDQFTTMSGRDVTLRIYSETENIGRCGYAMGALKRAMRWDENYYGREYDLNIFMVVAVNDFNMGAMENKGLNIFNAKLLLASPDTATDSDYQSIEAVVAHEYFHNWTGNRITCRDWFQLSLKEGFTVYRDQEFSADMGSRGVKRIEDVRLLRAHQFAEDASPMAHPVRPDFYLEINNFYTLTVYEKGAELVRMQAHLLGDDFRKATDLYFERYDGQAVTTDDFVSCMQESSGRDLSQFKRWYSQAGTPELQVSSCYDSNLQTYSLTIAQHTPETHGQKEKLPLLIPVAVGLLGRDGQELVCQLEGATHQEQTVILELTEKSQTFVFINIPEEPVPSLLRGFSAPVKLHYDYSNEELLFLMANDSDGFVRWDAAQTLHQRVLLARVSDPFVSLPYGYLEAIRTTLNESEDLALATEILTLPSESYLGDQMDTVDVDGIHAAREGLRKEIATQLEDQLFTTVKRLELEAEYQPTHEQIAARSLKNLALTYLARVEHDRARQLVLEQYHAHDNMTDVMAALSITTHSDWENQSILLADFEQRWKHVPLVMDKWFSVQATAASTDTLDRVTALMQHSAFTLNNPNRVRALIGAFVSANPVAFHRADGAGYELLADVVIELNRINPQIAARLIRQMSRWRRYDEKRQALMQKELNRIFSSPDLSKDVLEIVTRSLN